MLRKEALYLPPELLYSIVERLENPRDLAEMSSVNRRWHELADDPWLWLRFVQKYFITPISATERVNIKDRVKERFQLYPLEPPSLNA